MKESLDGNPKKEQFGIAEIICNFPTTSGSPYYNI
jgi:hypothetical protein